MSAFLGNIISNLQQAADTARQAREARARSKTDDGRRIYRIACLGHANSGKTTFWTTLEGATREISDQFNLQTGDNTTAAYLMRQREAMQQGVLWSPGAGEKTGESPGVYEPGYPAQTDLVADLLFMARQPGRPEFPLLVQDYPGDSVAVEDLGGESASVVEFLKSADGVLFFVDGIVTRLSRSAIDRQLAAFRSLLRRIEDRRGQIAKPVGVVFTKSDTLPGFRRGNPVVLLQPSDLRRRHEPFSKFLEQLLRSGPFAEDPAWRDRVSKTMSRVQSFADMLLKKCASPQFFFVSAVGDKRRRPIEVSGDLDASIVVSRVGASLTGSVVLGKNQVGLQAPVAWMVNELAVKSVVNRARGIRNRVLTAAAVWAVIVSLPFMCYLGCTTSRIDKDLRAPVVPARRLLHDVHAFEEDYFARFWGQFDRAGYMATASEARSRVAYRVQDEAHLALLSVLVQAASDSNVGGVVPAESCRRWALALEECSDALRDTSEGVRYRQAILQIRCQIQFYRRLGTAFSMPSPGARRAAIAALGQPNSGLQLCTPADIRKAIENLLNSVLNAIITPETLPLQGGTPASITATVGGGTPPYVLSWLGPPGTGPFAGEPSIMATTPGTYTLHVTDAAGAQTEATCIVTGSIVPLKDRYNAVLKGYGPLALPEARLNPALIADLQALQSGEMLADAPSQETARRIATFLQRSRPFLEGVSLRLSITSLSTPAKLKLVPGPGEMYTEGDEFQVPKWKIGQLVTLYFVEQGVDRVAQLRIADLLGSQLKPLAVPGLKARGGGEVTLQYEIVEPRLDDIPPLEPMP